MPAPPDRQSAPRTASAGCEIATSPSERLRLLLLLPSAHEHAVLSYANRLGPHDGNADHDRMERKGQRQINDNADRNRDQVVADAAHRNRRAAGILAMFQRNAVIHRPAQERAEQDDGTEIAI